MTVPEIIGALIATGVFGTILGAYIYIHSVEREMAKRARATEGRVKKVEDCVESEMKALTKSVTSLELVVTNRLTAVEVALDTLKKGVSERHSE